MFDLKFDFDYYYSKERVLTWCNELFVVLIFAGMANVTDFSKDKREQRVSHLKLNIHFSNTTYLYSSDAN